MNLDISSVIFISFLIATLILGLASSRGVSSIKEYAIGNRNFSTATIVATIVATWISGGFFYSSITEAYNNGLYSIWVAAGDPICLFVIGILWWIRLRRSPDPASF